MSFYIAKQVDKLKVLSESLASSTTKAEKRISDNRFDAVFEIEYLSFFSMFLSFVVPLLIFVLFLPFSFSIFCRVQKEEALNFRVAKANEVSDIEKVLLSTMLLKRLQRLTLLCFLPAYLVFHLPKSCFYGLSSRN